MGLDAGSREVLLDLIYRLSLDDKASDGEARAPGDGAAKERRGKERSGDDGDDEARPNSCEKNPWAGRAESAESEELRLDVDGGSIARCLGSTAFMYGATARKWDSPAGVATGSAGRVSWTFW